MHQLAKAIGLCGTLAAVHSQSGSLESIRRLFGDSSAYTKPAAEASKWRRAVLARDVKAVADYGSVEARRPLIAALSNARTWQYRYVFGGWTKSLRSRLESRSEIIVFEHPEMLSSQPRYYTVCFVTSRESAKNWTSSLAALKRDTVRLGIPCEMLKQSANNEWVIDIESLDF